MPAKKMSEDEKWASIRTRYNKHVIKKDGCWDWSGSVYKNPGYPHLGFGSKRKYYCHVLSYVLHVGSIPQGMHVCHTCDNKRCTNPGHLFLGSNLDNARDARKKGLRLKPTCRRGHVRTEDNTYILIDKRGYTERHCKVCKSSRYSAAKL